MSGKQQTNVLLFNKWDTSEIEIADEGLKNVILIKPFMTIPITFGRHEHQRLKKSEVHIIERAFIKLMILAFFPPILPVFLAYLLPKCINLFVRRSIM